jgi:hypothetical protein
MRKGRRGILGVEIAKCQKATDDINPAEARIKTVRIRTREIESKLNTHLTQSR